MKEVANNLNILSVVLSVNNLLQGKGVETTEQNKGKRRKSLNMPEPEEQEGMPQH
jgi:hypothetical protein